MHGSSGSRGSRCVVIWDDLGLFCSAAGQSRNVVWCHHLEARERLGIWLDGCLWKNFHWLGIREATHIYDTSYIILQHVSHDQHVCFILFSLLHLELSLSNCGCTRLSFPTGSDPRQVCHHQQRLKEPVYPADSATNWTGCSSQLLISKVCFGGTSRK